MGAPVDSGKEMPEPRLLDGDEDTRIRRCPSLVRTKLGQRASSLPITETKASMERSEQPEAGLNGLHVAACSALVPKVAGQQVGTALDSSRARLVCDVAEECYQACCQACRDPQEQWRARCPRPRLACTCR
jgi:hypothetical protein